MGFLLILFLNKYVLNLYIITNNSTLYMDTPQRSISFRELSWDDVDSFARNNGFKDRSPFIEYCTAKEIHRKRFERIERVLSTLAMLMGFTIVILLILLGV